jgi:multimeric flavodoxin WrbA
MSNGAPLNRRNFLGQAALTAGATLTAAAAAQDAKPTPDPVLILGFACSCRAGGTTARSVQEALDAARNVDPSIQTELLDLGDMNIAGWTGGADASQPANIDDDFPLKVHPALQDHRLGGLIIGSPSYFRSLSSRCKAFLERLSALRSPKLLLADLPVGALAVGAYRNGGQELVIEQILTAMLCHETMSVGGKPKAYQGATLWNFANDDITQDELGMDSARKLGARVAEAALRLRRPAAQ